MAMNQSTKNETKIRVDDQIIVRISENFKYQPFHKFWIFEFSTEYF